MEFELPVNYQGRKISFPAVLQQSGYSHKIQVEVQGVEIAFEPDEERNYRAIIHPDMVEAKVDVELLKAIAAAIESFVK